jgi:hypothetical protein
MHFTKTKNKNLDLISGEHFTECTGFKDSSNSGYDLSLAAPQGARTNMGDADMVNQQPLVQAQTASREDQLGHISMALGIEITGVIQRGRDPSDFFLLIDGNEIRIGNTKTIKNQEEVSDRISEYTLQIPQQIPKNAWTHFRQLLFNVTEYQETLDPVTEMKKCLCQYLATRVVYRACEKIEAVVANAPFKEQGKVWINLEHFHDYLEREKLIRGITRKDLVHWFKQIRFVSVEKYTKVEDRVIKRRYWGGLNPDSPIPA